jgi:hypothetical protein
MKRILLRLVYIGKIFLALVIFSGCSGGSSDSSSATSSTATTSPPTSSVGGTVSGLLGTGLVLQNNAADDLVVAADQNTFKFPTRLPEGSTFNVTILSQPINPAQFCEVLNGNRIVSVDNITDVQVECRTTMLETFDSGAPNLAYWNFSGLFERQIVNGELQLKLAAAGEPAYEYLPFVSTDCGKISADVTLTETVYTGTGEAAFSTRLQSCGYHTATAGEAPGTRTGDVGAAILSSGTKAYYRVFRCLNYTCNDADSVEYLTPNGSTGILLGTAPVNSTSTLLIDWDSAVSPGQFTFQLNSDPPVYFDPVAAGADITAPVPNKPEKSLGNRISLSNPDDKAEMTATFDNVIDGLLSDNFDSSISMNGSFWQKTVGRRRVESGRLVMEISQEFVGDPVADTRYNKIYLISEDEMIPTAEVVAADLSLDPATFVDDNGGTQTLVSAVLLMKFRPPGVEEMDSTNLFEIYAGLTESSQGVTAEILAVGCADYSCSAKHTIVNNKQTFNTPVVEGQSYRLEIEHLGNGRVVITLDNQEQLSVDLSTIAEFAVTEFSAVELRTASKGTDTPGEEAFIRAFFDNIQAGNP